jgi:hypothetical protein
VFYVTLRDGSRIDLPADRGVAVQRVNDLERSGRLSKFQASCWREQQKGSGWTPAQLQHFRDVAGAAQRKSDAQRAQQRTAPRPRQPLKAPAAPSMDTIRMKFARLKLDDLADGLNTD